MIRGIIGLSKRSIIAKQWIGKNSIQVTLPKDFGRSLNTRNFSQLENSIYIGSNINHFSNDLKSKDFSSINQEATKLTKQQEFHAKREDQAQNNSKTVKTENKPIQKKKKVKSLEELLTQSGEKENEIAPTDGELYHNPETGEVGGPQYEPTKFGDWSKKGRVSDF